NGCEYASCPKSTTVLTQHPAIVFRFDVGLRYGPLVFDHPGGHILRRKQNRDRLADHFVRHMTEQPLGAGIPTDNSPFEVEQDERMLAYLVDKQLQHLVGIQFRLLVGHSSPCHCYGCNAWSSDVASLRRPAFYYAPLGQRQGHRDPWSKWK